MATTVKVGTIFIQNRPLILRTLGLESEPYEGTWDVLHSLPSVGLDQKIRGSGWNYFFIAAEVRAFVFGRLTAREFGRLWNGFSPRYETQTSIVLKSRK